MIEVQNISKTYGDFLAVSKVSFSVADGDILGFLGPNGAGKTTTLRALCTFLKPTSGTAKIAGFDLRKESHKVRESIGYLPENPPLYPDLKVDEYLTYIGKLKGLDRADIGDRLDYAIDKCGLKEVTNKLCKFLSRGFRQRVGLAQAIINNPKVLILDEPTSGLDPQQVVQIRELISELAKNTTVIFSTHILPEVVAICNRVVILNRGEVVLSGLLEEVSKEASLEHVFLKAIGT